MGFLKWIYIVILGKHPYNTIFSYNYHNIRPIVRFMKKAADKVPTQNNVLVDIGAGQVPYFSIFSSVCNEYIAVDMEGSLPENDPRSITQKTGMAEDLPLSSDSADVVLSNQVLEHVLDPIKAVAESHRILKPGGLFIGSVPHISPVHLEPYDFRRYTDLGLKKLLEEAGFINIQIEGNSGVFGAVAFMLNMDFMMSLRKESREQKFSSAKAIIFSPLVGLLNLGALVLDTLLGNKQRSPSNLCWMSQKPDSQ